MVMAQGLQVFGEKGNITLDLTKRFAKIVGKRTVTGDGEITASGLNAPNNKLWYFLQSKSSSDTESVKPLLRISSDGKRIFWKNIKLPTTFYYGVY